MPKITGGGMFIWEMQPDAVLDQANPVSGTKYEVLATTKNVKIVSITGYVTWTVQPDPLEFHVTIDGVAYAFYRSNPASNTFYVATLLSNDAPATIGSIGTAESSRENVLTGKSVKIEGETTGGTVSKLYVRVRYAIKKAA